MFTALVIGATGEIGHYVVPELVRRGIRVRALIRREEQRGYVLELGSEEAAVGDLTDEHSLKDALAGAEFLFYLPPAFMPNEADVGVRLVELALRSGIRRMVFSGVLHPALKLVNHSAKMPVESAIAASGMEFTILQPTMLYQNIGRSWRKVVENGYFAEPWSKETRFSRVDYRDVAELAGIAFAEDRLVYGTFELCADGFLNRHDIVALMQQVLGKPVRPEMLDRDTVEVPQGMMDMFAYYDHHSLHGNPLMLRTILGREPRTLHAYLQELAGVGAESRFSVR